MNFLRGSRWLACLLACGGTSAVVAQEMKPANPANGPLRVLFVGNSYLFTHNIPAVVADVARSLEPHRLCSYLHSLAEAYSAFYQECPVL